MRTLGEAAWCILKHLLLAKVHIHETLEKLYRTLKERETAHIDRTTQTEVAWAIANLAAAEEHITGEVLCKVQETEHTKPLVELLREACDVIRSIRQELASEVLLRSEVSRDVLKKLEDALRDIDELFNELKDAPLPKEMEQLSCPTCEEDLGRLAEKYREVMIAKLALEDADLDMERDLDSEYRLPDKPLCGLPRVQHVLPEGVAVLAPDPSYARRIVDLFGKHPRLKELYRRAVERGLARIYVSCLPANLRSVAFTAVYFDGTEVYIHPAVLHLDDDCACHVLAHELAHAMGIESESEAENVANSVARCRLGGGEVKETVKVKHQSATRRHMVYVELGGAFIGKGIQYLANYVDTKFTGKKPLERPGFYMNVGAGVAGLTLALLYPDRWTGRLGLGMACKILPDLLDYVLEYTSPPPGSHAGLEEDYEYSVPEGEEDTGIAGPPESQGSSLEASESYCAPCSTTESAEETIPMG